MKKLKVLLLLVFLAFLAMPFVVRGDEKPYTIEKNASYTRIYGNNRYQTSIALSDMYKQLSGISKFSNIIVASGTNFADALGGSYLSYVKQAPILISNVKNKNTDNTVISYINKNLTKGGTIYILGGKAAVSEYLETQLTAKGIKVKRLAGDNRYLTNIAILKEANVTNQEIIIATGRDFADSLSASAAKRPILLVKDQLSDAQLNYLKSISSWKYTIVGGETAVNKTVQKQLEKIGNVVRISGANRYETSVKIAERFFDNAEQAIVVYGKNYPDGLCGGPMAMAANVPVVLSIDGKNSKYASDYTGKNSINKGYVLGGNSLISEKTALEIFPSSLEGNAYAVLKNNGEFIFFRSHETYTNETTGTFTDTKGRTYKGIVFGDFEKISGQEMPPWFYQEIWDKYTNQMTKVDIADGYTIRPHSMYCWFLNSRNILSFDFTGLNTKYVTSLGCTFENNTSVTEMDLSMFDTSSVYDMNMTFFNCSSLKELDLQSFNTPDLLWMDWAFYHCELLEKLDIRNLDTSGISLMEDVFVETSLKEITLGTNFSKWINYSYLPEGNWTNGVLIKDERELYAEYPLNCKEWAGIWKRTSGSVPDDPDPDETTLTYAILKDDGDLVFINSYEKNKSGVADITDTNGVNYHGQIFKFDQVNGFDASFDTYCNKARKAYAGEGQTIVLKSMSEMFKNCKWLEEIDMTGFNTSEVDNAGSAFENCYHLKSVIISTLDTSGMTDMSRMFYKCLKLESLDISNFDTSHVTNMSGMFTNCYNLQEVILGTKFTRWTDDSWFGGNKIAKWKNTSLNITLTADELYRQYPSNAEKWAGTWTKQPLDVTLYEYAVLQDDGDLIYFTSENVYNDREIGIFSDINGNDYTGRVFTKYEYGIKLYDNYNKVMDGLETPYAYSVKKVYVADGQIIHYTYMRGQYVFCYYMTSFDGTGFDTSDLYTTEDLFRDCQSLQKADLSSFDTSKVNDMSQMFCTCRNLRSLDLSGFNTKNVTDMYFMFAGTWSLNSLDLSSFDTSNVTNMQGMFVGCRAHEIILPDTFKTDQVTDMSDMFYGAENVKELNLKGFNTTNVTNMFRMFTDCYNLESLDVSGFNTENLTSLSFMFDGCKSLTSIDISHFNTENVTGVSGLFYGCVSLQEVDISSLSSKNFRSCHQMFQNCGSLKTIYVSGDFTPDPAIVESDQDMFTGCTNLTGGNGTVFDAEHTDFTYARIDTPENPGYFTARP